MKRAVFVIFAAVAVIVAAFAIFDPFALAVSAIAASGTGHPSDPPSIAEGANFDFLHGWPNEPKWTGILQRKFPVGSSVKVLQTTLQRQGFVVDPTKESARYEWGGMPCLYTLNAIWVTTDHGKVASISGGYGSACL